jgi:hypothetical protein
MLQEVSGNENYAFNPTGFVMDEHHANFQAIKSVFGDAGVARIFTCQFHFKQSVERHAKYLNHAAGSEFNKLADEMLESSSGLDLDLACEKMSAFCEEYNEVKAWFAWWYARRWHVCNAFRPIHAPKSNLAEVGHAQMASLGRRYMSLLDAAREDVIYAIRQERDIKSFVDGQPTGGKGVSVTHKRARQYKAAMKTAESYAREVDYLYSSQAVESFVSMRGIHRPQSRYKKTRPKLAGKRTKQDAFVSTLYGKKVSGMSVKAAKERKRKTSAGLCEGQETNVISESEISCNRRALPNDKHVGKEVFHVTL